MEHNFLKPVCKFWLLLIFIAAVSCDSDDEPASDITCLPVELPGEESMLKLTYNAENKIDFLEYAEYDNPQPNSYKIVYSYTNGKVTAIDELADGVKNGYHTFEYGNNIIVEKYFSKKSGTSDFEQREQNTFYLQGEKVTSSVFKGILFSEYDSVLLTYDANNNVVHTENYNKNKVKQYTTDLEYDNKVNPYKISGVNGYDEAYLGIGNLSINNLTKSTYKDAFSTDTEIETVTYTYDVDGKPLTRKFDWEDASRAFNYGCN